MLKNIREIGIFMIAAQAVIHFAPGKQYEKYIKSVSGIIILLLFLKPFLQLSGAEWKEPETVLEKLEELTDMPAFPEWKNGAENGSVKGKGTGVGSALVSRMETEVKELLNRELEGEDYCVKQVALQLAQDPSQEGEMILSEVEITLTGAEDMEEESRIRVDEIVVNDTPDLTDGDAMSVYRGRFAALLGIEEKRVEVRQDGRG